jgi:cell division protein FtsL
VAASVGWIVLVAVLLGGVVAMNVAVLRLNLKLDDLGRQRAKLRAESAAVSSKLSSAAAAPRVQSIARTQLGLVPADSSQTTYLYLAR